MLKKNVNLIFGDSEKFFREFLEDEMAEIKKISRLKKKKPSFARLETISHFNMLIVSFKY